MRSVRIATRGSSLALAQARWVGERLIEAHPGVEVSMVAVTTTGDVDRTSPVATLTEVGAFVRAVQQAVIEGSADLAVHSCKDLPIAGPGDLTVFYAHTADPLSWQGHGRLDLTNGLLWDIPIFGIFSPVFNAFVPGLGNKHTAAEDDEKSNGQKCKRMFFHDRILTDYAENYGC